MPDVIIGAQLQLDANSGINSMKQFKQAVKDAKGDLIVMVDKFGETSVQAREAAKRVAELNDLMGDANTLANQFNPDEKFKALSSSLNGVLGGFTALTGAMGLLGVESEDVQRQLLKVQSALALSQGLNQVGGAIASFKTFGKTIVDTLGKNGAIGLAIAGVAALGAALSGLFTKSQSAAVKAYNDTIKDYVQAANAAQVKVDQVAASFELAKQGVITKDAALKTYNETLGESFGKATSLDQAEQLLNKNAEAYIKSTALKAQANALFAKQAEIATNALLAQNELNKLSLSGGASGGIDKLQAQIDKAKADAEEIKKQAGDLLRQAAGTGFVDQTGKGGGGGGKNNQLTPKDEYELNSLKTKKVQELGIEKDFSDQYMQQQLAQLSEEEKAAQQRADFINQGRDLSKLATQEILDQNKEQQKSQKELTESDIQMHQMRINAALQVGSTLGALAEIIGKQTAAGKALAIAQATINMWVGVTEVLRAKSTLPEPFGTIAKIANVAAVIATGINAIKNITKTQVPGGGSGGGAVTTSSATAPLQPQVQSTNTMLNQQQLNQIGNATARAFVVESDITGSQERIRRLNRAARL